MRIVHVEDFIHPDAGYQVNLLSRLQVKDGHEVAIVTAELDKVPSFVTQFFGLDNLAERDARFERETGVPIIRVPLLGYYSGRALFHPRLFRTVDELKPDVIFVHGEDTVTGMSFIWRSARQKYPMILDCHMLEMASVNRFRKAFRWFFRTFVTPVILRRRIPLIRVVDSDYVQKCLGIPLDRTTLLSFGTDTDHFRPSAGGRAAFRDEHGIARDAFVVLYAGKLDVQKGGQFLAESLREKLALDSGREVVVVVVGTPDGDYGAQVERTLGASENRVLRFPTQRYLDLARFYQAADVAVYPKQCSMSFFEAQSCGVPVLLETNEINDERAQIGGGRLFQPEDVADFRRQLQALGNLPAAQFEALGQRAREMVLRDYDYVPIARQFTAVLQGEVDRYRKDEPRADLA